MKDLKPEELQNSKPLKSTVTSGAPPAVTALCTASTKGFSTSAGLGVLTVPLNRTTGWPASEASSAEYFSSLAFTEGTSIHFASPMAHSRRGRQLGRIQLALRRNGQAI